MNLSLEKIWIRMFFFSAWLGHLAYMTLHEATTYIYGICVSTTSQTKVTKLYFSEDLGFFQGLEDGPIENQILEKSMYGEEPNLWESWPCRIRWISTSTFKGVPSLNPKGLLIDTL